MKKILFFMAVVSSLVLVSCSDEPFSPDSQNLNNQSGIHVTIDESAPIGRGITIGESLVVTAAIQLVDPSLNVQSAVWNVGGPSVFVFSAPSTGTYWIKVTETDTNNFSYSYSNSFFFTSGYNYYVNVTLGGQVIVNVGTNGMTNVPPVNTNTNTNTNPPAGGATFGIFSETVSNVVIFDTDTKIDIWNGMTIADDTTTAGDGTTSWRLTGTDTNGGWMGMGIRVEPLTAYRDLSAFASGSYRFMFKGTKGFKLGLKSGLTTEAWLTTAQLMNYGLVTNGTWCTVSIPVTAFTGLNMGQIAQYLMFVADTSTGYRNGDVFNLDNIYFTTNQTVVGPLPTTFGLYSETYPVNVVWDTDGVMDVWNNGFDLVDDTSSYADGVTSLKLICTASISTPAWAGYAMRTNPLNTFKDLSSFTGGSLKFSYKSTKLPTKIGIKGGVATSTERWITGAVLKSTYGLKDDGTWSTVTIPLSAFAGLNLTNITQYFMFVTDGVNHVIGNEYNIDNIYYIK